MSFWCFNGSTIKSGKDGKTAGPNETKLCAHNYHADESGNGHLHVEKNGPVRYRPGAQDGYSC